MPTCSGCFVHYVILALWPLGVSVGAGQYRIGLGSKSLRRLLPFIYILMLLGLAIAFVVIESKVEMLGLFRALSENSSLSNTALSQSDLLWVSLTLSLPVVASYVVLGMVEGERRANVCKLMCLQAEVKEHILADDRFAQACKLRQEWQETLDRKSELEAKIAALEASIETGFTTEELHRLEDMEMDATAEKMWVSGDRAAGWRQWYFVVTYSDGKFEVRWKDSHDIRSSDDE